MRASPEPLSNSGAHAIIIGTRQTIRFNSLLTVCCRGCTALEMDRDPADRFTDLGKILLQVFWLQIMVTTANPGITISTLCARLHMAVHEAETCARANKPLA
ncbi:hypothetical protein TcBrA4_0073020 [Trypanosoma cruzi]|nr:hypothetical protein TcBrA4_0073020 [Trypanosoma cruzi]